MVSLERNSFDNNQNIVIFDGECAFCNASVLFIRKHNKKDNLWYCSSQSAAGQRIIQEKDIKVSPEESLIYIKNGKPYFFSSAALEISKELDHFWAMLSIFLIVPPPIRDRVYKFIAKYRRSILKSKPSCSIEDAEHFQGRILK